MTTQRKVGPVGLSIPVIKHSPSSAARITSEWISKWRAALPVADTGVAAKKIFQVLNELSNMTLEPQDRFAIIEQIHGPLDVICSSLKRHFIEQKKPLDQNKVVIANLRQSLLNEITDNYKLIVDGLYNKHNDSNALKKILITSICRTFYYFNIILLGRYQLYSNAPAGLWQEICSLYKYAEKNNLLNEKSDSIRISDYFIHILLLSSTDPYHWRQKEQLHLNDCAFLWAQKCTILNFSQLSSKVAGIYVIDLNLDLPPASIIYKNDISSSCIGIDINKDIQHLKGLIENIKDGGLKTKIAHTGDPEYALELSGLNKLLKIWSQQMTRNSTRFPIVAEVRIAFGITAAHYYINNEEEFNPHPKNIILDNVDAAPTVSNLPTFEVSEEEEEREAPELIKEDIIKPTKSIEDSVLDTHAEYTYTIYEYQIENISNNGLCVSVNDKTFPPFQCGEIVAFKNMSKNDSEWSVGSVRWLKRRADGVFQIGIQLIAPFAKAAGIQFMRDDKPLGILQRCLVLPAMPDLNLPQMLVTATLPLHSKKIILYVGHEEGVPATLAEEVDASGMYYQYAYAAAEKIEVRSKKEEAEEKVVEKKKDDAEFDSIWDRL